MKATRSSQPALIERLRAIVGRREVLLGDIAKRRYLVGYRTGQGEALAVVRPGTLVEQWRVLEACAASGAIVIAQAANTGLTGGSTPCGAYDRPVVIVSTTRLSGVHLLEAGRQVVCLAGTSLSRLEEVLAPIGREPHSVIGSSCIGASVVGGVCNNSGGALVRRGPAYTELALYARIDEKGALTLVNHLDIALGEDPETILRRAERGDFAPADIGYNPGRSASDHTYQQAVRDLDANTPARFNADPRRLYEASGSAGKVIVFAVRLDTFARERDAATFYIGTRDAATLGALRKGILKSEAPLPISGEYIHRDAFDIALRYGKDTSLFIQLFGTRRIAMLFALKNRLDSFARRIGVREGFADRLLQSAAGLMPYRVPRRILSYRDRFEHHLILKVAGDTVVPTRAFLREILSGENGDFFECTADEASKAFLLRFAVAGAAVRYRAVHASVVEDIIALDIALPRNTSSWFETLPDDIAAKFVAILYYGHFFCHVFHQDYIVRKGGDMASLEQRMHALMDARGAEYPAEHNVGHLYHAKSSLAAHYRALDPSNAFNPGLGHMSRQAYYRED